MDVDALLRARFLPAMMAPTHLYFSYILLQRLTNDAHEQYHFRRNTEYLQQRIVIIVAKSVSLLRILSDSQECTGCTSMSITATNHFSSIATHVDDCLKMYDEVCTRMAQADHAIGDKLRPGTMDDTLGRFRLWAGNTRARRRGTASLDYKLREASHIRDRVLKLLQNLETVLVKALQIITGERVPWEDLSDSESDNSNDGSEQVEDEPTTELSQLASNMTEVIKCLMRLSMAISNPAPHNQFRESAHFDCEYFEQFDIEHVRAKFPLAGEYLVLRLGKAISRRRQYLRYREAYRKQLEKDLDDQTDPSTAIDGTVASSLPTIARACTFTGALDEGDYNDTQSQTSYASSNNDESKLRPPPLPKEGWDGEPFECPLCFRIISVRQTTSWYKHVYRDLQPYVSRVNYFDMIRINRENRCVQPWSAKYPIASTNLDTNGSHTKCKNIEIVGNALKDAI
jgi:hypothetical protein